MTQISINTNRNIKAPLQLQMAFLHVHLSGHAALYKKDTRQLPEKENQTFVVIFPYRTKSIAPCLELMATPLGVSRETDPQTYYIEGINPNAECQLR